MQSWIRLGGSVYHGKFYPKTTIIAFDKNYEQPICTKIVLSKDPRRRIKPCIALGLPAEAGEPRGNDYSIAHNP
jgi:hypothetical protein